MLAAVRLILLALFFIASTIVVLLFVLIRPFHRNNVRFVASIYGKLAWLLGVKVELRNTELALDAEPVVYIANHQNSYDIFTASNGVRKNTVSVGKKSLVWIPFFGWVYYLTGNILIDRNNRSKAHGTIGQAAQSIKDKGISVWLFPEGTRSNGRGILKFKTGAFYTAYMAGVPIVPVAISSTHQQINLNRWNNGKVVIEYLPAMTIDNDDKAYIRQKADEAHDIIKQKVAELDQELATQFDR